MLVAEEISLIRVSQQVWPCMKYFASPKAQSIIKELKGYTAGGIYVEYFDVSGLGEYTFTSTSKILLPFTSEHIPKKTVKKFDLFLESVKQERVIIDSVIEVSICLFKVSNNINHILLDCCKSCSKCCV